MQCSFLDAEDPPETDPLQDLDFVESLLMRGDDLQKISVIENLPRLFDFNQAVAIAKVIPKLQQELLNSSCEVHIVASRVFRDLFEKSVCGALVQTMLVSMDSKDPIIAAAWFETLLAVTKFLPIDIIKSQILPIVINKTQLNKPLLFRVASCKMLGQIASHPNITSFDIKKDILPLLQSLCQDYQFEVRASMCGQIPQVAKGLQNEILVRQSVMPNLVELCSDENANVRIAAIDVLSEICNYLTNQTLTSTILPLFKQVCSKGHEDTSSTFPTVAKNFGKLISHLYTFLAQSDCLWFFQVYHSLSKRGFKKHVDVDPSWNLKSRENCALGLPAVARFVLSRIPNSLEQFYTIVQDLSTDPCYVVRKAVAKGILDTIVILDENAKNLKMDIIKLMRDEADEVLDELVPNLGRLLQVLYKINLLSKDSMTTTNLDIGKGLMKCQMNVFNGYRWRLQAAFLRQMEFFPSVFPSEFIHQQYTPGLFVIASESRYKPVRLQATRTLLVFLRFNIKDQQRKWIRDTFFTKLCCSKSCHTRIIYVKLCVQAADIFSNRYFKEYFMHHLLSLMDDNVANVRLAVVNTGPLLRKILLNPPDKNAMSTLENCFTKLQSTERDLETLRVMKCKLREMKQASNLKPAMLTEEKRRIDEEDKIAQGKSVTIDFTALGHSVPVHNILKPQSPTSSFSPFSPQLFYRDAGVDFPKTAPTVEETTDAVATISLENTNIESLSENDLRELQNSTTNLTDDVKVNLKKLDSQLRPPKDHGDVKKRTIKRYSSVTLYENPEKVVLRRRSLNVSSDLSKIPVSSFKNATTATVEKNAKIKVEKQSKENINEPQSSTSSNNNNDSDNNNGKNATKSAKASHLPVFKKRIPSDKK